MKRLLNIFKKSPRQVFPDQKHVIELAFVFGGVEYFHFKDLHNAPYERALTALTYYREIDLNADHDFLRRHCEAIDKVLLSNPIDVFKIKQLNELLAQRIKLPKDTDLLFKLASVVYFDKNENPTVYDYEYNRKKIEGWKANATPLESFFLQQPLTELVPYLKYADQNLSTFSRITSEFKKVHSAKVSDIISGASKMTSSAKNVSSQAATPQNSKASASSNTIGS